MSNKYLNHTKLESQWHFYFDKVEIDVQYKPQTFKLSSGMQVTPTFFLPKYGYFAQITGGFAEDFAGFSSMFSLCEEKKISILSLIRQPDFTYFTCLHPTTHASHPFSTLNIIPDFENDDKLLEGVALYNKDQFAEYGSVKAIEAIEAIKASKIPSEDYG